MMLAENKSTGGSTMDTSLYQVYLSILKAELVPAMGCTEPIAIAYAAALAAQTLGATPEEVEVFSSPNIIKNVKSVVLYALLEVIIAQFVIILEVDGQ